VRAIVKICRYTLLKYSCYFGWWRAWRAGLRTLLPP